MARKRLIKGANAARVEERIARVPADVALLEPEAESSIFDALRALEGAAETRPIAETPPKQPRAIARRPAPSSPAPAARPAARKPAAPAPKPTAPRPLVPRPAAADEAEIPARASRLGPSDFSAAEREAIVRCCSDYKNRLPTYLLAVQKEVRVLDSVIDKCLAAKGARRKN